MCSINGFIKFKKETVVDSKIVKHLLIDGINRGRDSAGIYTWKEKYLSRLENERMYKSVEQGKNYQFVEDFIENDFDPQDTYVLLNNMRAEPTTNSEWIRNKGIDDTQPFINENSVVVHNGTISNDMIFSNIFDTLGYINSDNTIEYLGGSSPIDSVVLLNSENAEQCKENLRDKFIGSYAIAQYFQKDKELVLSTNYMLLYLCFDYDNEIIYFASSKEGFLVSEMYRYEIYNVPPYSMVNLRLRFSFELNVLVSKYPSSIYPSKDINEKHLIVCSGGLDSGTLLNHVVREKGKENVRILHFTYSCKAEERELSAIKKISKRLGVEYEVIDLSSIFKNVLSSSLTNNGNISEGDTGIEYAHEWVPARNLIMMSIAIGYAEKNNFTDLYLGANLDEASAYPDNTVDFLDKLNGLIPYSIQNGKQLRIRRPMVNLMKHEIVKMAIKECAPLDLMWSCYHDGKKHCGKCGPCTLRKLAFEKNYIEDIYISYGDEK